MCDIEEKKWGARTDMANAGGKSAGWRVWNFKVLGERGDTRTRKRGEFGSPKKRGHSMKR